MSAQENWQTKRSTVRERTKFMLNNDLFSDVKFVVYQSEGKNETSKQVIAAHKFVLSIGSPVFEAMFYGELAETRDSITLPDCEYESLLELFRYMYSDEVNLSGGNVMRVLYLAKKYMVPSLADKCTEYLEKNLDPSNVFSILPTAEKYEEKDLVDRCWKVIDKQTEAVLKSDGFATIERSLLEIIVLRDALSMKEVDLFKAVDLWAAKQCQTQGLAVSGKQKRKVLGEKVIKAIRFPVMKQEEFASIVLDASILTPTEVVTFFKFFSSPLSSPVGFPVARRVGSFHRCGRVKMDTELKHWNYGAGRKDYLGFTVDKNITLQGICLYGSENNDYTVTLEVKDDSNNYLVSKSGIFSSKSLQYRSGYYYGFEVLFDSPAYLKEKTMYRIEALITGPTSGMGSGGRSTVLCSSASVTFTFSKYLHPQGNDNGTSPVSGQFPEFLFSL